MELNDQSWKQIRRILHEALGSSRHCSIATVNEDGSPHVTPIGGLILNHAPSGYFVEILATSFKNKQRVCVLAVNSSRLFWIRSLIAGKFSTPPGARLIGEVGERREASEQELRAFHNRIRARRGFLRFLPLTKLKGYGLLWGNIKYVRYTVRVVRTAESRQDVQWLIEQSKDYGIIRGNNNVD